MREDASSLALYTGTLHLARGLVPRPHKEVPLRFTSSILASATALVLLGCPSAPTPGPGGPSSLPPGTKFITGNLDPMIVDWQPEQRGDLEISMKSGLVVVAYDDTGFRLLGDCHVDGTYDFMGMTRRERIVRLESVDDIRANLPLGGLGIAAKIGGELQKGATLDIAMVMVGKLRTTWRHVSRTDLVGQCAGASHFVRGATVGAFAVDKGEKSHARAVAEIFGFGAGGGTASSGNMHVVDGALSDCQGASPDSPKAPKQCGALIRVELLAISASDDPKAAAARNPDLADVCPKPLVLVEGKCSTGTAATPVECTYGEGEACVTQCKAGNAMSCAKLAMMTARGEGTPKSPENAPALAARACKDGAPAGCTMLGGFLADGVGIPRDLAKAAQAYAKACDEGEADGCGLIGMQLLTGMGIARDTKLAAKALSKGCNGGSHGACSDLGLLALGGQGFDKDLPAAARLFKRACDGDSAVGCSNFAYMEEFGQGVPRDARRGVLGYAKACKIDDGSCTWLGAMLHLGKGGLTRDEGKAVQLYKLSCDHGDVVGCAIMKTFFDPSAKVDQEHLLAYVNIWKGTCASGIPRDCSGLGVLAMSVGQKEDAKKLMARGCELGDEWGCLVQKLRPRL